MSRAFCAIRVCIAFLILCVSARFLAAQTDPSSVWPMTGHDAQRTGRSTFSGPTTAPSGPSWTFSTGAAVIGDLAISAEGIIYFASDKLYALNPDGTPYVPAVAITPLTSPTIDDVNGFIYVIANSSGSGYDVLRYSKQLQDATIVYHGSFKFVTPTPMIIGPDGTLYFSDGVSIIAVGAKIWETPFDPCFGNPAFLTPALGRDGSVYSMCQPGGGAGTGGGIYRFDGNTGMQVGFASYSRGGTEPIIDSQNNLHAGFQAFDGIVFDGSYDTWDADLNRLTPTIQGDFTTSRAALFTDGFSTVRIGASFQANGLVAEGAHVWGVLSGPQTLPSFSTVPMVDASDNVFVGTASGVVALNGVDGSTLWFQPLADAITTQPAVSAGGVLFVGSSNGNIYAFESKPITGTIVVSTNNAAATFTISDGNGNTVSGSGISFTQSASPGSYMISYGDITGFINPVSETQVLPAGGSISFIGTYIAKPTLTASPSIINFLFQQGFVGPIAPQEITITSSGTPVVVSASSSVTTAFNWLSVTPLSEKAPVTLSSLINPLTLQPGIYNGSITLNSIDALNTPLIIPVQLVVTPQNPPLQPRPVPGANRNHQIDLVPDSLTGFSVLLESDRPLQSSATQITSLVTIENNWQAWYFVTIRGVRSAAQNLPSAFLLGPGGRRSFQVTFAAGDSVSFNADATIAIPPQTDQDLEMLSVYGAELFWRAFTGNPFPQDVADFAIQVSAQSDKFANLAIAASQLNLVGVITAIERITGDPLLSTQLTAFGLSLDKKISVLSQAQRLFRVMQFEVDEFVAAEKFPTDTLTLTAIQH